jgi:hypothetical protein
MMARRPLDPEEKKRRETILRAMLEEAKREYAQDDALRARYDRALAAVTNIEGHVYSLNNIMLLEKQATMRGLTLSRVGAFGAWIKHGRSVRKGDRGLMAYAPHLRRGDAEVQEDGDDADEARATGFHVVHLFDESQTQPLAESDANESEDASQTLA